MSALRIVRALAVICGLTLALVVFQAPYTGRGAGAVEFVFATGLLGIGSPNRWKWLFLVPFLVLALRGQLNRSSDQHLATCKQNLEKLASQLEADYARQHQFPKQLQEPLPSCPAAGRETYSASYEAGPESFTLYCQGQYHCQRFYDRPDLAENSPYWDRESVRVQLRRREGRR